MGIYREHGDPTSPKAGMRMTIPCTNAVTCGSVKDVETKCGRCRIDVDKIVEGQTGMWFSYYRDPITGKAILKDRQGESTASKRARLGPVDGIEGGEEDGSQANPSDTKQRPSQAESSEEEEKSGTEESPTSRSGSWSSHGHVEL